MVKLCGADAIKAAAQIFQVMMLSNRLQFCLAVMVVLVTITSLAPIVQSPYLGDDSWRESTIRGVALLTDKSLWELIRATETDFLRSGRWYPLVLYYYPVFYFLDRLPYKILVVVFTLANVMLFGLFVKVITRSTTWALIATLLPVLTFQLRFYHDPMLSYYFLMQIEFLLVGLSLIFLVTYLRRPRLFLLVAAVASYTACLLTYEAFYGLCVLHLIVAYLTLGKSAWGRVLRIVSPFFFVSVLNLILAIVIRANFGVSYEGVTLGPDLWAWANTFAKQVASAFPLSYFFLSDAFHGMDTHVSMSQGLSLLFVCVLWASAWCVLSRSCLHSGARLDANVVRLSLAVGLAIWILPAPIVALSTKYQRELTWGLGYLPAYMSGFGVALIILAAIMSVYDRIAEKRGSVAWFAIGITAAAGCTICGINYRNNVTVVEAYRSAELRPRQIIENAMCCGLLRCVPQSSYLLCDLPIRGWDNPAFFKLHSGLTLQVVKHHGFPEDWQLGNRSVEESFSRFAAPGSKDLFRFDQARMEGAAFTGYNVKFIGLGWPIVTIAEKKQSPAPRDGVYFLKYGAWSETHGFAVLAKLRSLRGNSHQIDGMASEAVWVYIGTRPLCKGEDIGISGNWVDESLNPCGSFLFRLKDVEAVRGDAHGQVILIPRSRMRNNVDPRSVVGAVMPP